MRQTTSLNHETHAQVAISRSSSPGRFPDPTTVRVLFSDFNSYRIDRIARKLLLTSSIGACLSPTSFFIRSQVLCPPGAKNGIPIPQSPLPLLISILRPAMRTIVMSLNLVRQNVRPWSLWKSEPIEVNLASPLIQVDRNVRLSSSEVKSSLMKGHETITTLTASFGIEAPTMKLLSTCPWIIQLSIYHC